MKFLSTVVLLLVSSAVFAHTGDHNGIWHDHGVLAQALVLVLALSGLTMIVLRSLRTNSIEQKTSDNKHHSNEN